MTLRWAAMACRAIALAAMILTIAMGLKPAIRFIERHEIRLTIQPAPRAPMTDIWT